MHLREIVSCWSLFFPFPPNAIDALCYIYKINSSHTQKKNLIRFDAFLKWIVCLLDCFWIIS